MKKFIREIEPFAIGATMRVHVALQRRPRLFDSTEYDGLHYLLVDEEGSSIHAMIEECYYGHMLMMVGEIYDISKIASKKDTARHKVADHHAILCFTEFTLFEKVERDLPSFPKYSFNLRKFAQLPAEAEQQTLFADMYGCIKAVKAPASG